jgi:DNA invertase Pin-like site-specific DNA recombinase
VWKLDRLVRFLKHLIETVSYLQENKIDFQSLRENIDTTISEGKLIFHIFASLAEFERDLIRDRTRAGLASARARVRLGGRPRSMNSKQLDSAKAMLADPDVSIPEVCQTPGVLKTPLYCYLKQNP